jgi:hypothetical protein
MDVDDAAALGPQCLAEVVNAVHQVPFVSPLQIESLPHSDDVHRFSSVIGPHLRIPRP